jgi:hypothetical protein
MNYSFFCEYAGESCKKWQKMNFPKCNISSQNFHEKIEKYVLTNGNFRPILGAVRGSET